MKTYMRPRYQCDFCGKRGGSKHHMQKHENGCTKNPFRECRMCQMMEHNQKTVEDAMRLLPNPDEFREQAERQDGWHYLNLDKAVESAMPNLRKFVNDCPACILAALRQRGIPVPIVESFNFTEECKAWWVIVNDANCKENYC